MILGENKLTDEFRAYLKLRALWYSDPCRYFSDRLGINPTIHQRQMLEAIAHEGAKVSARAGHGVGKTAGTGGIILWFLETREYSKIVCTAPTAAQLRDILWAELYKLMRKSDTKWQRMGVHKSLFINSMFRLISDRICDAGSAGREWFASARTSGKDNPDALQGFHASNLEIGEDGVSIANADDDLDGKILFVIDEASGVFEKVFEVSEGALSSHGARLIMIGNPVKCSGFFYRSHNEERAQYTTLHFRSADSPLVDEGYRDRLVERWGEKSNVVRVRADGEFPLAEDDVLMPLEVVELCVNTDEYLNQEGIEIRIGVDVAGGESKSAWNADKYADEKRKLCDRSTIVARQGLNVLMIEAHRKLDTMEFAVRVKSVWNTLGRTGTVYIEVNGMGIGVAHRLRELGVPMVEVNVCEAAPDSNLGDDYQAKTMRDYLWMSSARFVKDHQPAFLGLKREPAEQLAAELSSVKFAIDGATGKFIVESKDEIKKRLGFSPDLGDAFNTTFYPYGLTGGVASSGRRKFG